MSRAARGGLRQSLLDQDLPTRSPARSSAAWPGKSALTSALLVDGAPLAGDVRSELEARLGTDLGDVRIHDGQVAAAAADSIDARAFTVGASIYFGAGEYAPWSASGRALLAHEVAHTVQQGGLARPLDAEGLELGGPSDAHEAEAEAFASAFAARSGGAPRRVSRAVLARPTIQRVPRGAEATSASATDVDGTLAGEHDAPQRVDPASDDGAEAATASRRWLHFGARDLVEAELAIHDQWGAQRRRPVQALTGAVGGAALQGAIAHAIELAAGTALGIAGKALRLARLPGAVGAALRVARSPWQVLLDLQQKATDGLSGKAFAGGALPGIAEVASGLDALLDLIKNCGQTVAALSALSAVGATALGRTDIASFATLLGTAFSGIAGMASAGPWLKTVAGVSRAAHALSSGDDPLRVIAEVDKLKQELSGAFKDAAGLGTAALAAPGAGPGADPVSADAPGQVDRLRSDLAASGERGKAARAQFNFEKNLEGAELSAATVNDAGHVQLQRPPTSLRHLDELDELIETLEANVARHKQARHEARRALRRTSDSADADAAASTAQQEIDRRERMIASLQRKRDEVEGVRASRWAKLVEWAVQHRAHRQAAQA